MALAYTVYIEKMLYEKFTALRAFYIEPCFYRLSPEPQASVSNLVVKSDLGKLFCKST